MFGSPLLEMAICMAFIYALLALICTAINELVVQSIGLRARGLKEGIHRILTDDATRAAFVQHPLIRSLGKTVQDEFRYPSYIPSRTFALVLLDIIAPAGQPVTKPKGQAAPAAPLKIEELRAAVAKLDAAHPLRPGLLTLLDAADGNIETARKNIELWFDSTMDRIAGWYKRRNQWILLAIAFAVVICINADTLKLATTLWHDGTLRLGIVAAAEQQVASGSDLAPDLEAITQKLHQFRLPLGWTGKEKLCGVPLLVKLLGLSLTAFAISLGAPFWFDLLSRFVNLRGAGNKPKLDAPKTEPSKNQ